MKAAEESGIVEADSTVKSRRSVKGQSSARSRNIAKKTGTAEKQHSAQRPGTAGKQHSPQRPGAAKQRSCGGRQNSGGKKNAAGYRKNIRRLPTSSQLRRELERQKKQDRFRSTLRSTIGYLIVVAACAVLVATLLLPVLRIYGTSMTPTLNEGEIVVSVKGSGYETGDIIAFYYEGKILIKRVIAASGSWVDIDEDGNVYVDGVLLDEPYLTEKALGECDIELPYQVPDERVFVMGDHRATSVDSRSTTIGAVAEEEIVGKIVFRVWPLTSFGVID